MNKNRFFNLDRFLGIVIMGATGGTIGFYLGGILLIFSGLILGSVLGYAVAGFGARLFFVSVLVGFLLGCQTRRSPRGGKKIHPFKLLIFWLKKEVF